MRRSCRSLPRISYAGLLTNPFPVFPGGKTPFGQLPILEVDGVLISQSNTILRYVAREVGEVEMQSLVYALSLCLLFSGRLSAFTRIIGR